MRFQLREWLIRAVMVGISLAVMFVILEVGVRLLTYNQNDFDALAQEDPYIARKYKQDVDRGMTSYESGELISVKTNSLGFSGDEPRTKKSEEELIIVHLGDSFTAAMEVNFNEKYTQLLKEELRTEGREILSYNFGVGGQGTGHALATYRHYAAQYDPDVVILWFYLGNDFEDNLTYEEGTEDGNDEDAGFLKKMFRKSKLARLVVTKAAQVPLLADMMRGTILTRVGDDSIADVHGLPIELRLMLTQNQENERALSLTQKYLEELQTAVQDDGGRLYVGIIPRIFQTDITLLSDILEEYPELSEVGFSATRPNSNLREILQMLDIPYFDVTERFIDTCLYDETTAGHCSLYLCKACHLSTKGHTVVTEETVKFLKGQDL